jgi:uncharacterized protein (TIGR03083 family)
LAGNRLGLIAGIGEDEAMPDHLAQLDRAASRFAQQLAEGDLQASVPSCPGWRLADLGAHLGEVHQWADHAIVAGNPDAVITPAPAGRTGLVEWYRQCADALLSTLKNTDPAAPAWGFGPKPQTASFWFRRQAQETTLHLWDAVACRGEHLPLDADLARDGIDEVVAVFFPRQVRLGRIPALTHSLALAVTDPAEPAAGAEPGTGTGRWVLAGDGLGSAGAAPAQATVTGPAVALYLLVWGRIGLDDPRLTPAGDREAALAVLQAGVTP